MRQMNERYGLGLRLVHDEGLLYVVTRNGHRIWLVGVDDKGQVDKLRGNKLVQVVVDEAMAMPDYLKELIEDSIEPSLMDLSGSVVIAGTPCPIMAGYFWEATTGGNPDVEQWPTHHFNVLDNTFLPHARGYLENKLEKDYGGNAEHPTYLREWLGQWVEDIGALVYPFTVKGNSWTPVGDAMFGLPPGEYSFGLGVDIGFAEKSTAFTLGAQRKKTGQIYLLRSWCESELIPTALAAQCQVLRDEVIAATKTLERPRGNSLRIVVDEGALGKGFAAQMKAMGVGCEAAVKSEKRAYQEYVGGLIRSSSPPYRKTIPCFPCEGLTCRKCGSFGEIATDEWEGGFGVMVDFEQCAELIAECRKLQFDAETGKESDSYRRHAADSALYLIRSMMPGYSPEKEPIDPLSPEGIRLEMKAVKERAIKKAEKARKHKYG